MRRKSGRAPSITGSYSRLVPNAASHHPSTTHHAHCGALSLELNLKLQLNNPGIASPTSDIRCARATCETDGSKGPKLARNVNIRAHALPDMSVKNIVKVRRKVNARTLPDSKVLHQRNILVQVSACPYVA